MSIDISPFQYNLQFYVCSYKTQGSIDIDSIDFCSHIRFKCWTQIYIHNESFYWEGNIPTKDHYFFYVTQCNQTHDLTLDLDYTFMNPGGQYLSTDEIPLPKIFLSFLIIWVLVVILWFINWLLHRDQKIKLHTLITLTLCIRIITIILQLSYWQTLSKKGKVNLSFYVTVLVFEYIQDYFFFGTIILIAKGWCITREKLRNQEKTNIILLLFFLVFLIQLFDVITSTWIWLIVILLFIVYFLILRLIFKATADNKNQLKVQMIFVRNHNIDPRTTPHFRKYQLFKQFHWFFSVFVVWQIICFVIGILFLIFYPWLVVLLLQIADFVLLAGITFIFRLKTFHPLFEEVPENYLTISSPNTNNYESIIDENDQQVELKEWRKGMILPQPQDQDIIILQNPNENTKLSDSIGFVDNQPQYHSPNQNNF
eukprot:Anaeramoba_ignava/a612671_13.p1 GENE.a612671_13~~a612671_13.p1  ORF type:complete len:449 (+),score=117.78 a612671_13:72-1349(+)